MIDSKKFILGAGALAVVASISISEPAKAGKKEKCYGIVKAGRNDCASADGSHSCAGLAKTDGDFNEWVLLPSDTCERIIGGLKKPGKPAQES